MRSARLKDAVRLLEQALRSDGFDLFRDMAPWARDHRDWLAEMAALADPGPGNRGLEQCLHAQVHPGNVIFRAEDGETGFSGFRGKLPGPCLAGWDVAHLVHASA
jgi:Ser/Thr protein kinase RdoA (MazF antagonist)